MISSLELNFDLSSEMLGFAVEKKNPAPKEGEPLKLYIPILMPNIPRSLPVIKSKFINKGSKLFLNASSCRPSSKVLLNTQNYITGYLEKNSEWANSKTSIINQREVENADGYKINVEAHDYLGRNISINMYEKYKTYYIVGGEKVDCFAPNGKLSKLLFNNDIYFENR